MDNLATPADDISEAECPLCFRMMTWESEHKPSSHEWCDDCRDMVETLVGSDWPQCQKFRQLLMSHMDILKVLRKNGNV